MVDIIELCKEGAGRVDSASGNGTLCSICLELLKYSQGADQPYRGGGLALRRQRRSRDG